MRALFQSIPRLRELAVYLTVLGPPARRPAHRFVIFGQGRSGSGLLVQLLNSSPEVHCEGEILGRKKFLFPFHYVQGRSKRYFQKVYGFKVKIYQLVDTQKTDPGRFLSDLHRRGWRVVYLKRSNLFRQALSNLIARERKVWHWDARMLPGDRPKRVSIDPQRLLGGVEGRVRWREMEEAILRDLPHFTVHYETDLLREECHQGTLNRLFEYLEIPPVPVKARLRRTSMDDLSQLVENYEEITHALSPTPFATYLSRD